MLDGFARGIEKLIQDSIQLNAAEQVCQECGELGLASCFNDLGDKLHEIGLEQDARWWQQLRDDVTAEPERLGMEKLNAILPHLVVICSAWCSAVRLNECRTCRH